MSLMTKAIKLFIKVFAGVGVLLVLLAALALILSHVLDTDSIGRSLAAELEVRYHIRSERIKISLLPSPRMTLFDVRTTLPDTFTASAEAVRILPRILPLLKGKLAPAEIELLSPMVVGHPAGAGGRLSKILFSATLASQRQNFPVADYAPRGIVRRGYRRSKRRAETLLGAKPHVFLRRYRH